MHFETDKLSCYTPCESFLETRLIPCINRADLKIFYNQVHYNKDFWRE